ncbi:MAG: ABC transporter permease [Lewinellaceae bacterium]|nr:ABC transporter permease [Lewinellaceae bacterium]
MPTLLIISMVTFALSQYTGTDPVQVDYADSPTAYLAKARSMGLDKPVFYFSLLSKAYPDTLHRILPVEDREQLVRLAAWSGNWAATSRYWQAVTSELAPALQYAPGPVRIALAALRQVRQPDEVPPLLQVARAYTDTLRDATARAILMARIAAVEQACSDWKMYPRRWNLLVPALHWHGVENRYHAWLSGFVTGNPGTSIVTGNPLLVELRPRLLVTLLLNGMALLLAYLIGIPLGVFMARHQDRQADRWLRAVLLFLYAMPVIWLGSLLILLLSRQDVGLGLINGLNAEPWLLSGKPFGRWAWDNMEKFVLPVLTLTLHALAILAIQMRGGILEVIRQDYIRTARAKGLSERLVFWRHAFRNGLFPVITVFANFFPALFGGSLVVEYLFDFPGMGTKMVAVFAQNDYAVLFAMVMFAAAVTVVGTLVADVLYALADPRVRFGRR